MNCISFSTDFYYVLCSLELSHGVVYRMLAFLCSAFLLLDLKKVLRSNKIYKYHAVHVKLINL